MKRWTASPPFTIGRCSPKSRSSTALTRKFTAHTHEAVDVRCGSAGHVTIDLYNLTHHHPQSPIVINLPPLPGRNTPPPDVLQSFPVASINYRWSNLSDADVRNGTKNTLCWPTPVHDTAFAYAWIANKLAPEENGRRDVYVFGSHIGASLAMSLALTESHPHKPLGIRGVVAHNGVYNWTMFLPDHRINRVDKGSATLSEGLGRVTHLSRLQERVPTLFGRPANMFDSFASPSLFFHNPGLLVPKSFNMTLEESYLVDALAAVSPASSEDDVRLPLPKPPRKSRMIFPPRDSTLKIPETLLLYSSSAPASTPGKRRRSKKGGGNTLAAQAEEITEFLRSGVVKVEYKEKVKWDGQADQAAADREAARRIQAVETGPEMDGLEIDDCGKSKTLEWLRERTQAHPVIGRM